MTQLRRTENINAFENAEYSRSQSRDRRHADVIALGYSKSQEDRDVPERGPVSRIVMARLVRAIYSSTYAATDGPDLPHWR